MNPHVTDLERSIHSAFSSDEFGTHKLHDPADVMPGETEHLLNASWEQLLEMMEETMSLGGSPVAYQSDLTFLPDKHISYYLPAYLIEALRNPGGEFAYEVVGIFDPEYGRFKPGLREMLTGRQLDVVTQVLEYLAELILEMFGPYPFDNVPDIGLRELMEAYDRSGIQIEKDEWDHLDRAIKHLRG